MSKTKQFYVGIDPCGCYSAMLIDDEMTTPKEVAEFARRMQKTKRRMSHVSLTQDETGAFFHRCPHKATGAAIPEEGEG